MAYPHCNVSVKAFKLKRFKVVVTSKVTYVTELCEVLEVKVSEAVDESDLTRSKEVVKAACDGHVEISMHMCPLCEYRWCTCINNVTECSNCETCRCMCAAGMPFDGKSVSTSAIVRSKHAVESERGLRCHSDAISSEGQLYWMVGPRGRWKSV